jgi:hypothetical protein
MAFNIEDLHNPFPGCFPFKYFLYRDGFNPFGLAAVEIENGFFESFLR